MCIMEYMAPNVLGTQGGKLAGLSKSIFLFTFNPLKTNIYALT